MVDPTKVNPRRLRSLATRSDSSVRAGRSVPRPGPVDDAGAVDPFPQVRGERSAHVNESSGRPVRWPPHPRSLSRLRTIPGSSNSSASLSSSKREMRPGVEAVEGPPVVLPLVEDGRPGEAGLGPFEMSISNRCRSSCDGTPHSSSWYRRIASEPSAQSHRSLITASQTTPVRSVPWRDGDHRPRPAGTDGASC